MADLLKNHNTANVGLIAGATRSIVNNHRVLGALQKAKEEGMDVVPPLNTDWSVAGGKEAAQVLLKRIGNIDTLWTAGPDIALGAINAFKDARKKLIISSFDWSENNIRLVEQGQLQFSYGGHFTEAGWALILLYDYYHGLDFSKELGVLVKEPLKRLDASNVAAIAKLVTQDYWQTLDFQQFSKCLNSSAQRYKFTLAE